MNNSVRELSWEFGREYYGKEIRVLGYDKKNEYITAVSRDIVHIWHFFPTENDDRTQDLRMQICFCNFLQIESITWSALRKLPKMLFLWVGI
jgi:hypothetical protein